MITRIVRMSFRKEQIGAFLEIFDHSKEEIRAFDGCHYLSLHQDHHCENVFYTLSRWKSQAELDEYRQSDLFRNTWARTKILFDQKPQAFSLDQLTEIS